MKKIVFDKEKLKIFTVVILLGICVFLIYYFHKILNISTVFTHFFYIPIILASLWWKRKGLIVAVFLALLLVFSDIYFRLDVMIINDYFRAFLFMAMGFLIAVLSEKIEKSERETKTAYSELNQIFNTAADGMCMIGKDYTILRINDTLSSILGKTKDEMVGKKCYDVYRTLLCQTPDCPLIRILDGKECIEDELELGCTDGRKTPCILTAIPFLASDGEIVGIVEDFKDITERKKAENTLWESENKHRTLLENLPQKIFLKDKNLVYISCNDNYARDLNIESNEIIGKTDYDFFPKELAEKYRADDKRIIESGRTKDIEEEYIQDGQKVFVQTVKTPVKDEKGNVFSILGIFWDITERKQLEEERIKVSKLEAINNMVVTINHEMNQPLSVIISNAGYLMEEINKDSKVYEDAKLISDEARKLAKLVKKIRNIKKIKTIEYSQDSKMIDLSDIDEEDKND